jgi:hypothetical protein
MAEVEIRIPKDLGLSQEQRDRLQESFDKQLADTLQGDAADKADDSRASARAKSKSKSEVV